MWCLLDHLVCTLSLWKLGLREAWNCSTSYSQEEAGLGDRGALRQTQALCPQIFSRLDSLLAGLLAECLHSLMIIPCFSHSFWSWVLSPLTCLAG